MYVCVSLHLSFRSQEGDHCQIDAALYTQVTAAILEMSEFVFCDAFKDRRASLHLDFFMTKSMLSAFCNSPGIPPVSVKQLNLICLDEFDLFFYFLTACKYVQTFSKLCGATSKQADSASRSIRFLQSNHISEMLQVKHLCCLYNSVAISVGERLFTWTMQFNYKINVTVICYRYLGKNCNVTK